MTSEHSKVEIQTSSSLQDAFGKPEYSLHGFRRRLGRISQSRSKTGTDGHPSSSENLINKEEEPRRQTDSNRNKGALTEFHLFGCLPPEIRLLIWEHATQYKRRVVVHAPYHSARGWANWLCKKRMYHLYRDDYDSNVLARHRMVWTSTTLPPTLLSVSHEARQVALRSWELAFGFGGLPGRVWINFDRDDVVFVPGEFPKRDFMGGLHVPGLTRLFGLQDHLDDAGHRVKPVSVLAEVWQDTPDMGRIQRMVLVNCDSFVDRGVHFTRNTRVFRSLKFVDNIFVVRAEGLLVRAMRRPEKDMVIATQGDHVYARAQMDVPQLTGVALGRAQISAEEDEWNETYMVHGLELNSATRAPRARIWLGQRVPCLRLDRWVFASPWPTYVTVNGKAY